MRIEATETLSHAAQLVFETVRDKTPELVEIMPNIERVEVLERREEGTTVHLRNRWQGSKSDVPAVIRPFASKDLSAWFDRAAWNSDTLTCSWQIESIVGREMFSCEGQTTIRATGDKSCSFELRGELKVDPNKVPGVPRFLGRKIQGPLERFIVGSVSPNLTGIAKAVQRFLDSQGA